MAHPYNGDHICKEQPKSIFGERPWVLSGPLMPQFQLDKLVRSYADVKPAAYHSQGDVHRWRCWWGSLLQLGACPCPYLATLGVCAQRVCLRFRLRPGTGSTSDICDDSSVAPAPAQAALCHTHHSKRKIEQIWHSAPLQSTAMQKCTSAHSLSRPLHRHPVNPAEYQTRGDRKSVV